jgi:two-component system CheB/CheR fusion protein
LPISEKLVSVLIVAIGDRGINMAKKKRLEVQEEDSNNKEDSGNVGEDQELQEFEAIEDKPRSGLIVVGIGASAGGLSAFEQFFTSMPAITEYAVAFIIVQHLDPAHKSILSDLIKQYTKMDVSEVTDGVAIKANCTYIIPPNKDMALMNGKLYLMEQTTTKGLRLSIDHFFRSLANDQHERAICILFSGTGSDGTQGLKEIKAQGGMVMVQDPESADYDGMLRSAIATGMVDFILPPDGMPAQLNAYIKYAFGGHLPSIPQLETTDSDTLRKILFLLHSRTGHDFSQYKPNTINRRIERRMAVNQVDTLGNYLLYIQQNLLEVDTLFKELLIGVTSFFRDKEAFDALKERVIIPLLASRSSEQPLRIWIPGCSTGEEALSIGMLVQEVIDYNKQNIKVQIFATDIDSEAIEKARTGIYLDNIIADIAPERLSRFFQRADNNNRVLKNIRDMIIFAVQNVIRDSPFSKMDLISCRNLLIYMDQALQKKVISLFTYSLNPNGYLFLGNSESVGEFSDLFNVLDRKGKIFQCNADMSYHKQMVNLYIPAVIGSKPPLSISGDVKLKEELNLRSMTEQTLLEEYSPACAVINEKGSVLYIHGRTGRYLEPAIGEANLNIIQMARDGLRIELANAIHKVTNEKKTVSYQSLHVLSDGGFTIIDLFVKPITGITYMSGLIMVIFKELGIIDKKSKDESNELVSASDVEQRIKILETELRAKDEYLQTTMEELETSNEELKSTNEELQSSNEEWQSGNEELETSKEELQSINEELTTVNNELQQKLEELTRANNDINNLMSSTNIGTIFVNNQLLIQRFTPPISKLMSLIPTDVGRSIGHIVYNLNYTHLVEDTQAVLDTLIPKEMEIQSTDGLWYLMRILPYRTIENVIDGAVLTFVDISEQRNIQQQLAQQQQELIQYAENIVETIREPLIVLDGDLHIFTANSAFYQYFQVNKEDTEGIFIYDLGNGQWNIPDLRKLLEEILPQNKTFENYRVEHDFENIGRKVMLLNARELIRSDGKERMVFLSFRDEAES